MSHFKAVCIDATNLLRPPHCRSVQHALIKGRTEQRETTPERQSHYKERKRVSASRDAMHSSSSARLIFKGRLARGPSDCAPSALITNTGNPAAKLKSFKCHQDDTHTTQIALSYVEIITKSDIVSNMKRARKPWRSFNHANWCTESLGRCRSLSSLLQRVFALIRRLAVKIRSAGLPASQEALGSISRIDHFRLLVFVSKQSCF